MLGMTYMLELCGNHWTTFVGIAQEFFWTIGWLSLGGLAYIFTDWRYLIVVTSAPGFLIIFYHWILMESPKWLLSVGRFYEAEMITRKMAQLNGRHVPSDWTLKPVSTKEDSSNSQAQCLRIGPISYASNVWKNIDSLWELVYHCSDVLWTDLKLK